jgi:hypothetical protein
MLISRLLDWGSKRITAGSLACTEPRNKLRLKRAVAKNPFTLIPELFAEDIYPGLTVIKKN